MADMAGDGPGMDGRDQRRRGWVYMAGRKSVKSEIPVSPATSAYSQSETLRDT